MPNRRERDLETVTVIGSQVVATAEGATALALTTRERGTIAFAVNLEAIEILRRSLTKAEQILRAQHGHG